jgi:hypothetical protein
MVCVFEPHFQLIADSPPKKVKPPRQLFADTPPKNNSANIRILLSLSKQKII